MAQLNSTIKKALMDSELFPLATATPQGIPNVVPIKYVLIENDQTLWLVDNFMNKTLTNIQQNPFAALYVYQPEAKLCVQIKGRLELMNSGPDFERMRQKVHETRPDLPAKSLVILHLTELYQCMPGPEAGLKMDS